MVPNGISIQNSGMKLLSQGMVKSRAVLTALFLSVAITGFAIAQNSTRTSNPDSQDELTPVRVRNLWGYADKGGQIVVKPQFTLAHPFSEGLALVWTGGVPLTDSIVKSFVKMGYIDPLGHWIIHSRYKYYFYYDFSEGVVPFRETGKGWGYMDTKGKIIVGPQFDWAGGFSGGNAAVLLDERCTRIDKTGKILSQAETSLPRQRYLQNSHGAYLFKPRIPPCP